MTEVFAFQFSSATGDLSATENSFPQQNDGSLEAAIGYPFLKTQSSNLSDILKDSFKKTDSFTRWMSKELPEVEDSQIHSSSGGFWSTEEANNIIEASSREPLDQFTVSPMLSQDQLFSIVDFAPNWTYVGSKTKVWYSNCEKFIHSSSLSFKVTHLIRLCSDFSTLTIFAQILTKCCMLYRF